MGRFVASIFGVCLMVSCTETPNQFNNTTITSFDLSSNAIVQEIRHLFSFDIRAQNCYYVGDSVFVVITKKQMGEPVVQIINESSMESRTLYEYGGGDGQLLSVQSHFDGRTLLLHDYIKHYVCQVDVVRACEDAGYEPGGQFVPIETQYIIPGKEKQLLYLDPQSFSGKRRVGIIMEGKRTQKPKNLEAFNIVRGQLFFNSKTNRICYVDQHNGVIEIWDQRKIVHRIKVEMPVSPQYSWYNEQMLIFKGKIPFSFRSGCSNDSIIAVLFDPYEMQQDESADYFYETPYVFILDWMGNVLEIYKIVGEKRPTSISITSKGDIFYMSIENTSIHLLH